MKRLTARTQTLLTIGFVLASLILLNIVSIRLFGRLDMTRNRLFTLSEASKTIVGQLDDKVTVKAYFTEDLPSPYNNHRRQLLDQLNEYRAYARGNLAFEFVDPTGEKAEQDAQQQGIAPVQVQVVKEDKFEVKRAYMGLVIQYEDRREVIPVIQNPSTLEYEISSTIKRLTTKGQRKIGFLTGHGEPAMQELGRIQETASAAVRADDRRRLERPGGAGRHCGADRDGADLGDPGTGQVPDRPVPDARRQGRLPAEPRRADAAEPVRP